MSSAKGPSFADASLRSRAWVSSAAVTSAERPSFRSAEDRASSSPGRSSMRSSRSRTVTSSSSVRVCGSIGLTLSSASAASAGRGMIVPGGQCCKLLAVTLLTARDIREIAADIGLRPTKQKGQNFVIDPNTVRSIVPAAGLEDAANVVESGPGLGSLTLGLLEAGHSVTAVEIDEPLAARLPQTVERFAGTEVTARDPETGTEATDRADRSPRFSLVGADALKVTELPA